MLELILFEVQRAFEGQYYLTTLYKALFALGYYGLMRVSELTVNEGRHTVKAVNIHLAMNKQKLLVVLYTSKTHTKGMKPQKIKIEANQCEKSGHYARLHFCPFETISSFIELRGNYDSLTEEFFIFKDKTPVTAEHSRKVLRTLITQIGL